MYRIVPILFLLISCGSQSTPTPDWVFNSYSNNEYWVGIGSVSIKQSGDVREIARNQAIKEIASQIKIDVSSNFKSIITEHNYDVNDYSESLIETRVQNSLPHIEFDKFHNSEDRFYVLAKLSKQKYFEAIALKRKNAVTTAVSLIEKTEYSLSSNTFQLLYNALQEVLEFSDEPILVEYPENSGKKHNLYSLIKIKMIEAFQQFEIQTKKQKISIRTGGIDKNIQLGATCIDKQTQNGVEGIPLNVRIENSYDFGIHTTNKNGEITFNIPQIYGSSSAQTLIISSNLRTILGSSTFSNQFDQQTQSQIQIELIPIKIAVIVDESQFGKNIKSRQIEPVIKEYFANNLAAKFVRKEESDLEIYVSVSTRKLSDKPNEYGIYQSFADVIFTVINSKDKRELFSTSINNVKGADFNSNEASSAQAIKKIANQIEKEELPNILKLLTQS